MTRRTPRTSPRTPTAVARRRPAPPARDSPQVGPPTADSVFGFRSAFCVFSLLPAGFNVTLLPLLGLALGHIKQPNILISDMMCANPIYQSIYTLGFAAASVGSSVALMETLRHHKARCRSVALHRASGRFLLSLLAGVQPCLILLFSFNFEDPEQSTTSLISWTMHIVGTMGYFGAAVACCTIWCCQIGPELKRLQLSYPQDAWWFSVSCKGVMLGTAVATVVRVMHIYDRITWCLPMLLAESAVIGLAILAGMLGNLRCLMALDATEPVVRKSDFFG